MSRAGAFCFCEFRAIRPVLVAGLSILLATTALLGPPPAAAAPDCLAAPDGTPTEGRRWFYRLDHANNRKCWYLKAPGDSRAAPSPSPEATGGIASAPVPATPLPATPLTAAPPADAPVQAATDTAASGAPAAEPAGRSARPLDDAARDALYREFLAWRLQQPAD
ncbi:hypothetical protein [Rhodoplanes azumiensis]|uniref:Uncharacterized protein n=1 Tax=Rhodoplanes azumiensis TaxID=1897628 RepID=A0ABW5APU4_9BRAD